MASAAMKERLRRCALARPSRRFRSSGSSRSVITLFSATNTLRIQKNTVYSSTARQPQVKRDGGTGKHHAACATRQELEPRHRGDIVHVIASFLEQKPTRIRYRDCLDRKSTRLNSSH